MKSYEPVRSEQRGSSLIVDRCTSQFENDECAPRENVIPKRTNESRWKFEEESSAEKVDIRLAIDAFARTERRNDRWLLINGQLSIKAESATTA